MSSSTRRATVGSAVFFLMLPAVVAGLVPWWIADGWADSDAPVSWSLLGLPLVAGGVTLLVGGFGQVVAESRSSAALSPTRELVIGGLHRFVRNPMYLSVGAIIVGQAALFRSWGVLVYAMVFGIAVFTFVSAYEQPALARRYGARYLEYLRAVPGWWPRLTPWTPSTPPDRVGGC